MSALSGRRCSLRINLMTWLVVPVAAILAVSIWLSHGSALRQATLVMDRNLMASARIIAEQCNTAMGKLASSFRLPHLSSLHPTATTKWPMRLSDRPTT